MYSFSGKSIASECAVVPDFVELTGWAVQLMHADGRLKVFVTGKLPDGVKWQSSEIVDLVDYTTLVSLDFRIFLVGETEAAEWDLVRCSEVVLMPFRYGFPPLWRHILEMYYLPFDDNSTDTYGLRSINEVKNPVECKNSQRPQAERSCAVVGVNWDKKSKGWRALIRKNGSVLHKSFSVSKYGEDDALRLAIAAATGSNSAPSQNEQPDQTAAISSESVDTRRSGVVGVHWGGTRNSWKVDVRCYGVRQRLSFSVLKYGDKEALRLAIAARRRYARSKTMHAIGMGNSREQGISKSKDSGVPGVLWNAARNCWRARCKRSGKDHTRSFKVAEFGEEEALRLAIAARHKMSRKSSGVTKTATETGDITRECRKESGVPGVLWEKRRNCWKVRQRINGINKQQSFSVVRFGEEGALKMAIEARIEMVRKQQAS